MSAAEGGAGDGSGGENFGGGGEAGDGSVAGEVLLLAAGELRLRMDRLHVSRIAATFFLAFLGWVVSLD